MITYFNGQPRGTLLTIGQAVYRALRRRWNFDHDAALAVASAFDNFDYDEAYRTLTRYGYQRGTALVIMDDVKEEWE